MVNKLIDGGMKLLDGVFMQHEAKSGMYKVKEKCWQLSTKEKLVSKAEEIEAMVAWLMYVLRNLT